MKYEANHLTHVAVGLSRMLYSEGIGTTVRYLSLRAGSRIAGRDVSAASLLSPFATSRDPDSPLVSIILPVYNHADFLPHALKAVLAQTYSNWELIIVNDGSTDDFEGAVAPFLTDRRIKVLEQKNLKLPAALNNGFRHAVGDYFTWTSADNVMRPEQIDTLVKALESNPHCGLAYSDYMAIDDRGDQLQDPDWRRHNRPDGKARLHLPKNVSLANFHDSGDNFLGASFLWRSSVHDVVGAHDESTFGGEDYDFWLRMHLVTKFLHVPYSLYEYRVHDNTLNARAAELKLFDNVRKLLACDKERRSVLLVNQDHVCEPVRKTGYWRDGAQYSQEFQRRFRPIWYSRLQEGEAVDEHKANVLFIDVPLYRIDRQKLAEADVLVTNDVLVYHWLKKQGYPLTKRIIRAPVDAETPIVRHAAALALYEKDKRNTEHFLTHNIPATVVPRRGPKRLLLLAAVWGDGGLEQVILDVAAGARAAGIDVTIGCTDAEPTPSLRKACSVLGIEPVGFSSSAIALRDYVEKNSVEVVNYHHTSLGAQLLENLGVPTVYTVHNSYVWKSSSELVAMAAQLEAVSAFVCVSRQVAAYAHKWLAVAPEKINVIANGTTLPALKKPVARKSQATFDFICTATFASLKCHKHLLNAFAKVRDVFGNTRLTLVGFTPDEAYFHALQDRIAELGLEQSVELVTGAERTDALSLMSQSDCMVLPSLVEGWSIAAAEAMLLGLPLIVSNVGSAYDMQSISESVRVVRGKVPDILEINGDQMYQILQEDDEDYDNRLALEMFHAIANSESMKASARQAIGPAQELFSMDRALESYLELLRRV